MAIKHKFTSAATQGSDSSLVRKDDWNDAHKGGGWQLIEKKTLTSTSSGFLFATTVAGNTDELYKVIGRLTPLNTYGNRFAMQFNQANETGEHQLSYVKDNTMTHTYATSGYWFPYLWTDWKNASSTVPIMGVEMIIPAKVINHSTYGYNKRTMYVKCWWDGNSGAGIREEHVIQLKTSSMYNSSELTRIGLNAQYGGLDIGSSLCLYKASLE